VRHNNPHFRFIAAALAGSAAEAAALITAGGGGEEPLIKIASDETVLAPLGDRLLDLGLMDRVGTEAADFLCAYRDLNRERNRQILRELEDVAFELNQIGIEPVVLKGLAYLIDGVYADPAGRFLLDMDLLLSREAGLAALELLSTRGYTPEVPQATALARDYHLPALAHPERVKIEIHRQLGHRVADRILPAAEVQDRSVRRQLGRAVIRVPSATDLVTHLIVHSQLHHGYDQRIWPPLRAMYDLLLLDRHFAGELDWTGIRKSFRRHAQEVVLDLHLLQTAEALAMPLPYPIALGFTGTVRWFHRRLLWRWPWLRLFDPIFAFNSAIGWRLRLLPRMVDTPAGRRHVLASPFRWSFYRNLLAALQK
jgi:hypothetical protein